LRRLLGCVPLRISPDGEKKKMDRPLRLLIIEDSENDALLLLRELRKSNWSIISERVCTAENMRLCLKKQNWDVIVCDYVMPNFSCLQALKVLKEAGLDIPFILVSGQITDDQAVAAMKAGAHDFVMKGNLKRLIPAIDREIIEAEGRKERKKAEEDRRLAEIELRALANKLVRSQEEERRAIARELHDQTGQNLTVIKLLIDKSLKSAPDSISPLLKEAATGIAEVLKQVRDISLNLRPSMLDDLGLIHALVWMFDRLQKQSGLVVNFTQNIVDEKFSAETNITVFRIVQEALTNVLRYSGSLAADVEVFLHEKRLFIMILDKGRGFEIGALSQGASTGISAMRERAKMLNGTFRVESAPGTGTRIIVELPVVSESLIANENKPRVPSAN
jgi:signal transduction histidine kinase